MFNERRFKAQVVLAGMTMRQVAAELGIDEATLYRKMSGKSDFYRKEIQQLCTGKYFFQRPVRCHYGTYR